MSLSDTTGRINKVMHSEGFTLEYSPSRQYEAVYKGNLKAGLRSVGVKVCFKSLSHITLPVIFLDETPDEFPVVTPHYFPGNGYLCYADNQLAYIDVVKLEGQIKGCLQLASSMIEDIFEGLIPEKTRSEFLVYWGGGGIYFDTDGSDKNNTFGLYSETDCSDFSNPNVNWLLTSTINKNYYPNFNDEVGRLQYFRIHCDAPLAATEKNFPPQNLMELKEWLKESNKKAVPGLTKAFVDAFQASPKSSPAIALMLDAPNTKAAVLIPKSIPDGLIIKKPEKLIFGNHAKKVTIFRMGIYPLDERSLISRNAPDIQVNTAPDLSGKRLLLIGCGSVGGHIAELVARHGAGRLGGELTLADFDYIKPGNIGRHSLGMESLGKNKAVALKTKLELILPKVNVKSLPGEMSFSGYDLIIDATGDQSFNQFLSTELLRSNIHCPVVYSWVHGAGVGTQAFIQHPNKNSPCLHCINNFEKGTSYSLLKGDTENTVKNSTGSCSDWSVPYSAATAMHAAALAANLAIDWARGDTTSKIRSVLIHSKEGKQVKDKSVPKNRGCTYCATL